MHSFSVMYLIVLFVLFLKSWSVFTSAEVLQYPVPNPENGDLHPQQTSPIIRHQESLVSTSDNEIQTKRKGNIHIH